jgi:hypothetical protein
LFQSLRWSFRTTATDAEFTANALDRALRVAREEIPIDFAPAPHARVPHSHGVSFVRDRMLLRTTIDGVAYELDGSPGRIVPLPTGLVAAGVFFCDEPYAYVATFSNEGERTEGPRPIQPMKSSIAGAVFPFELAQALTSLVQELTPQPLATLVELTLSNHQIIWADLGARAARFADDRFEVHAAIWQCIPRHGMQRVALAIADALAPVVMSKLASSLQQLPSIRPSP